MTTAPPRGAQGAVGTRAQPAPCDLFLVNGMKAAQQSSRENKLKQKGDTASLLGDGKLRCSGEHTGATPRESKCQALGPSGAVSWGSPQENGQHS